MYLKQALGLNGNTTLEAVGTSFTTTDINAGICITGAIVQKVRFALQAMGEDGADNKSVVVCCPCHPQKPQHTKASARTSPMFLMVKQDLWDTELFMQHLKA